MSRRRSTLGQAHRRLTRAELAVSSWSPFQRELADSHTRGWHSAPWGPHQLCPLCGHPGTVPAAASFPWPSRRTLLLWALLAAICWLGITAAVWAAAALV